MELSIRIERKGDEIGTVGWLSKNAASIRITSFDKGMRADLMSCDGTQICPLAISGTFYEDVDIVTVERFDESYPWALPLGFAATDACWESIRKLSLMAVQSMKSDAEPITFNLEKESHTLLFQEGRENE